MLIIFYVNKVLEGQPSATSKKHKGNFRLGDLLLNIELS